MTKLGIISGLAVASVVGLMFSQAQAETLRAVSTKIVPQTALAVCPVGIPASLDLSDAAGNQCTLAFATTVVGRVVIRFNAECSMGGATTAWLDSNIIIDPAGAGAPFVAVPSNSDNALCSGNGTATQNDGWVSALTQVIATVPAGVHTVRVSVTPFGSALWRIDDISLTVESQP
jgi:hypothetical protein